MPACTFCTTLEATTFVLFVGRQLPPAQLKISMRGIFRDVPFQIRNERRDLVAARGQRVRSRRGGKVYPGLVLASFLIDYDFGHPQAEVLRIEEHGLNFAFTIRDLSDNGRLH